MDVSSSFASMTAKPEFNTLLLTDWVAHTPPEILASAYQPTLSRRLHNLWIFQGQVPGSLQDDRAAFVLDAGERPAVQILGELLVGMGMSAIGTNAKYRLALKLSAYRGRSEVIGAQSE
jgi:hypothetical protein